MNASQLALQLDTATRPARLTPSVPIKHPHIVPIASGEKGKAQDILAAIRTLKGIERDKRPATDAEQQVLARFPGFGPVALSLFPDPVRGAYKDAGWQTLAEELKADLTPEEYDSAKRTTFNQFFTSPIVMRAMYDGLNRLGVPDDALVLEPLCGGPHKGSSVAQTLMWLSATVGCEICLQGLDSTAHNLVRVGW